MARTLLGASMSSSNFRPQTFNAKRKRFPLNLHIELTTVSSLKIVFASLSRHQIREVQEWVKAIDFGCDIVGQLPLEVSEKIAWYLPLHDIVAAQHVSHKWSRIFTTPHTLKPLLQDWYDDASSTAVSSLKTEQVDAYRTGSAFSFRGGKWDLLSDYDYTANTDSVAYANGILAWIDQSAEHVFVRQLETGREQQIPLNDEGHKLKHVAVSFPYVAATNRFSYCHIWDLNTAKSHCFWISSPNTSIQAVAMFGNIFVEQRNPRSRRVMPAKFVIWEFESLPVSSRCFSIDLHKDSYHWSPATKLMFQHAGKYLVMFEYLRDPTSNSFYFTRIGINGQVQSKGQLFVDKPPYTESPLAYGAFTTARPLWTCVRSFGYMMRVLPFHRLPRPS